MLSTIGILTNREKDKDLSVTRFLLTELDARKVDVIIEENLAAHLERSDAGVPESALLANSDILVVLGGDGTILNAARRVASKGIPILGINLGRLGFLTEVEVYNIPDAIEKLLSGEYIIEERMMLSAKVSRAGVQREIIYALNDVGIARGTLSRMMRIEVHINDCFVDKYPADGIIVSSPTGSTAYSLSAGGPIISPSLQCLLLTPICPHTLHSRPIVIANNEIVRLKVIDQHQDAVLTVDGQQGYKLSAEDDVSIQKAEMSARFIRLKEKNFYTLLRQKLSEWSHWINED